MTERLDDIVRAKLAGLRAEGQPDWSDLSERLDGAAFDDLLRDRLDGVPRPDPRLNGLAPVVPMVAGWEALDRKLDAGVDATGDAFDRLLADRLERAAAPAEAPQASWRKLSHRIDTLWPLRRRLARYRVLEIAAAVALVLSAAPLLRDNPVYDTVFGGGGATAGVPTPELADIAGDAAPAARLDGLDLLSPRELRLVYSGAADPLRPVAAVAVRGGKPGRAAVRREATAPAGLAERAYAWAAGLFDRPAGSAGSPTPDSSADEVTDRLRVTKSRQPTPISPSTTPSGGSRGAAFAPSVLPQGGVWSGVLSQGQAPAESLPGLAFALNAPQTRKWRVGAASGVQVWTVASRAEADFGREAATQAKIEPLHRLSAVRRLGARTGLSLGLEYSTLSYDPEFPTVVKENSFYLGNLGFDRSEDFDGVDLEIARAPVTLRYDVSRPGGRAAVWVEGGAALNAALTSNYDITARYTSGAELDPGPQGGGTGGTGGPNHGFGGAAPAARPVPVAAALSDVKDFEPGLLQGGRLGDNVFVTARVGLEAEISLGERISAFGSAHYDQYLGRGLGPNADRYGGLGAVAGLRVSL